MDIPKKKAINKKPRKPRTKKPRAQGKKDKSIKQNVNVNVTSSGGTGSGSGGSAIPSAQPQYNPFLEASMRASKEENTNLIKQLENLKNKQEMGNQLLRDIQKKPNDMNIKQDIKEVLQSEQEVQTDIIDEIQAQEDNPSSSSLITPNKSLTPFEDSTTKKARKASLREEIKKLGGIPNNNASEAFLISQLQTLKEAIKQEDKEI